MKETIFQNLSGAKKPNTFFPFHTLSTALFLSLFFLSTSLCFSHLSIFLSFSFTSCLSFGSFLCVVFHACPYYIRATDGVAATKELSPN
jgi:hypothetical protein